MVPLSNLYCYTLHCVLHYTALQCTALHCTLHTTPHTALHCTLHTTPHITLHCTALHCTPHITMQCSSPGIEFPQWQVWVEPCCGCRDESSSWQHCGCRGNQQRKNNLILERNEYITKRVFYGVCSCFRVIGCTWLWGAQARPLWGGWGLLLTGCPGRGWSAGGPSGTPPGEGGFNRRRISKLLKTFKSVNFFCIYLSIVRISKFVI